MDQYLLHLEHCRLDVEIRMNGFTVLESRDGESRVVEFPLSAWMVQGDNDVEVWLAELPPVPKEDGDDEEEPAFQMSLHRVRSTGKPSDHNLIVAYVWTDHESSISRPWRKRVFSHRLASPARFGAWSWERARPFERADAAAIEDVVSQLGAALARRDLKSATALLSLRTTEIALGLGTERSEYEDQTVEALGSRMAEDDYRIEPVNPAFWTLEQGFGGRVTHVRRGDAAPISGQGGGAFSMSVSVCNLDGAWRIVR